MRTLAIHLSLLAGISCYSTILLCSKSGNDGLIFFCIFAPRYGNNCKCKDSCSDLKCFQGDVNALSAFGYDSYKIDGCGHEKNVDLWYQLLNATGRHVMVGELPQWTDAECYMVPLPYVPLLWRYSPRIWLSAK